MSYKKAKIIKYGRYECRMDMDPRYPGLLYNVPSIERFGIEEIEEYIEFLKLLLAEKKAIKEK